MPKKTYIEEVYNEIDEIFDEWNIKHQDICNPPNYCGCVRVAIKDFITQALQAQEQRLNHDHEILVNNMEVATAYKNPTISTEIG